MFEIETQVSFQIFPPPSSFFFRTSCSQFSQFYNNWKIVCNQRKEKKNKTKKINFLTIKTNKKRKKYSFCYSCDPFHTGISKFPPIQSNVKWDPRNELFKKINFWISNSLERYQKKRTFFSYLPNLKPLINHFSYCPSSKVTSKNLYTAHASNNQLCGNVSFRPKIKIKTNYCVWN